MDVFSQLMEWPQVFKGSKGSEETRGTPLNRLEITKWPLPTFWKKLVTSDNPTMLEQGGSDHPIPLAFPI